MIVLHAAPVISGRLAGMSASVPGLVAAQNDLPDIQAALLTTVPGGPWHGTTFPVFPVESICRRTGRLDLPAPFDRPDLVVFHSTYIPLQARLARYLRHLAIPYVICPRGGMTWYSHKGKRWKKTAGNLLFFNRMVQGAEALHFLTHGEAEASAAWRLPSFILGNGIELPEISPSSARASSQAPNRVVADAGPEIDDSPRLQQPPGLHRPLRIAFMGRLHIDHKGLDMLVDACASVAHELAQADTVVEIFGPDCGGSTGLLAGQIDRAGIRNVVDLRGPISGHAKSELLWSTDVFVHPSRTEGHPIAVLEAIAHGAPCLLTPNTNMAETVVQADAGWSVDASVEGIAEGLRAVLRLPHHVLAQASRNARWLAENSFSWPEIAERSVLEYQRFAA